MKKHGSLRDLARGLFAALLILALLAGDVGSILFSADAGQKNFIGSFLTQAAAEKEPGSGAENGQITAKSKKKKTTATPKMTASPTPAVESSGTPVSKGGETTLTQAAEPGRVTPTPVPEGPITDPQSIADYLFSHDMQLPENFITKKQAQALGWQTTYWYVSDAAPGKSIGGDYFGNYEGLLPVGKGISYHEADCYYTTGKRNADRVIYSTDGRVWYTADHYQTFEELFPSVQ